MPGQVWQEETERVSPIRLTGDSFADEWAAAGANAPAKKHVDTGSEDAGRLHAASGALCFSLGDGVGGNPAASAAARLAVDTAIDVLAAAVAVAGGRDLTTTWRRVAGQVVETASRRLIDELAPGQPARRAAGLPSSTLCFGVVLASPADSRCHWANVGDSGLGLIRADHRIDWLSSRDAAWKGNVSCQTDGVPYPRSRWDCGACRLELGDLLVAGTDGATRFMHTNEALVAEHLFHAAGSLESRCVKLAEKCAREDHDDATALVIHRARRGHAGAPSVPTSAARPGVV